MVAHVPGGPLPDSSGRYGAFQGALHEAGLPGEVAVAVAHDANLALVAAALLTSAFNDHSSWTWSYRLLTDLTEEPPTSYDPGPGEIHIRHVPGQTPNYLEVYTTFLNDGMHWASHGDWGPANVVVVPSDRWSEPVAGRWFMMTPKGILVRGIR